MACTIPTMDKFELDKKYWKNDTIATENIRAMNRARKTVTIEN